MEDLGVELEGSFAEQIAATMGSGGGSTRACVDAYAISRHLPAHARGPLVWGRLMALIATARGFPVATWSCIARAL
jgi:hypothetical protein